MFKKYRVFKIVHNGSRFLKVPVAFTKTLDEARQMLKDALASGQHLCVECI